MLPLQKVLKFREVTEANANLSKDRSTKVGALILGPDFETRSSGWNGFPRRINDEPDERHKKPEKYLWVVHAEANAIANAARSGTPLSGCTLLVTQLFPCANCAGLIIQAGIVQVVAPRIEKDAVGVNQIWQDHFRISRILFEEASIRVDLYER
jgi:dCMP deaminase